jgi:hypothetical protein
VALVIPDCFPSMTDSGDWCLDVCFPCITNGFLLINLIDFGDPAINAPDVEFGK